MSSRKFPSSFLYFLIEPLDNMRESLLHLLKLVRHVHHVLTVEVLATPVVLDLLLKLSHAILGLLEVG